MSSLMDSEAYFEGRLKALNLFEFVAKFKEKEWVTMAAFAFSNSYVPGRADESVMVDKVYKVLLGREDHPREDAVRRLFYEAHSLASAEVERRMARPDEEGRAPRKLPVEERGARWKRLVAELPTLNLRGELEPSNALVDKCVEIEELNELRYLKWEEFTKRDQELKGVKKIPLWAEESGQLRRYYLDEEITHQAEDRLDFKYALQRRGLAFHMAHLVSFMCHEKLINFYFEEMAREAVDPTKFERVKIDQVFNADREVFIRMGEDAREGFKALGNIADKKFPLDQALKDAMAHPRVIQLLLPHPIATARNAPTNEAKNDKKRDIAASQQIKQMQDEIKRLKSAQGNKGGGKGKEPHKGKGKDSSRGKANRKTGNAPMPKDLWGMSPEVDGKKICFAYNMKHGVAPEAATGATKGIIFAASRTAPVPKGHGLHSCPEYAKQVMKKKVH